MAQVGVQPSLLSLQQSKPIASALLSARMPSLPLKGKEERDIDKRQFYGRSIEMESTMKSIAEARTCSKSFTAAIFRWLSGFMARRVSAFM